MVYIQVVRGNVAAQVDVSSSQEEAQNDLADICILIHSRKMPKERKTTRLDMMLKCAIIKLNVIFNIASNPQNLNNTTVCCWHS